MSPGERQVWAAAFVANRARGPMVAAKEASLVVTLLRHAREIAEEAYPDAVWAGDLREMVTGSRQKPPEPGCEGSS